LRLLSTICWQRRKRHYKKSFQDAWNAARPVAR
jgi:hypothetical protein